MSVVQTARVTRWSIKLEDRIRDYWRASEYVSEAALVLTAAIVKASGKSTRYLEVEPSDQGDWLLPDTGDNDLDNALCEPLSNLRWDDRSHWEAFATKDPDRQVWTLDLDLIVEWMGSAADYRREQEQA